MKLALDATYSLGPDLSGVGIYSRELLHALATAHPEARFLLCYRPHRFPGSFRLEHKLPPNCSRRLLLESGPLALPDLFHGLNQRLPARRPRRAVVTFHDLFVLTGDYSTPEFRRRFAEQARHSAENADAIIAVSAFTASQVEQLLGVERSRIHVVHHGVRPLAVPDRPRENVILHVGAIQKRKNVARLVEAFEKVAKNWRLVLAGSAGFGASEILFRIQQSPARARIDGLGYVSGASLAEWYGRASILAFPSLDEGFGIPVIEAMAAGLPVITSNRSALKEISGDAALLVNPEDSGEIADALARLTGEPALRADLSRCGRAHASQFTWEKAAERTWAVYESVMQHH